MKKDLISITDYSKEEYLKIMKLAAEFEENPNQDLLREKLWLPFFLNHQHAPVLVLKLPLTGWADELLVLPIPKVRVQQKVKHCTIP